MVAVHYVGDPTHKPSFFILSKALLHALVVNAYPSKIRDFLGVVDFLLCLGLRPHLGHILFSPEELMVTGCVKNGGFRYDVN